MALAGGLLLLLILFILLLPLLLLLLLLLLLVLVLLLLLFIIFIRPLLLLLKLLISLCFVRSVDGRFSTPSRVTSSRTKKKLPPVRAVGYTIVRSPATRFLAVALPR